MSKKSLRFLMLSIACFFMATCGSNPKVEATTSSHTEAIAQSEHLGSKTEKIEFLLKEAEGFWAAQKYQEAGLVCEYVLDHLNPDSMQAKHLARKSYEKVVGF